MPLRPRLSPLRYPGGKAGLYPVLRHFIRAHCLSEGTYVEPYAGGAGAAVSLLLTGEVRRIAINDLDSAIHAFWLAVVEDSATFIHRIKTVELSVAEWHRQREVYLSAEQATTAELGFATFYLNRTNHSGVLNGGPIGGLDQSGAYKIDARFNRDALAERIRLVGLYADMIEVTCEDGVDVFRRHAAREGTFIYADPPYFEKAGTLYLNAFKSADHERLAAALNETPDVPWLLTYDNVPQVAQLYPERRRREFSLYYSARRVMKATELAVFSDGLLGVEDAWTDREAVTV